LSVASFPGSSSRFNSLVSCLARVLASYGDGVCELEQTHPLDVCTIVGI